MKSRLWLRLQAYLVPMKIIAIICGPLLYLAMNFRDNKLNWEHNMALESNIKIWYILWYNIFSWLSDAKRVYDYSKKIQFQTADLAFQKFYQLCCEHIKFLERHQGTKKKGFHWPFITYQSDSRIIKVLKPYQAKRCSDENRNFGSNGNHKWT